MKYRVICYDTQEIDNAWVEVDVFNSLNEVAECIASEILDDYACNEGGRYLYDIEEEDEEEEDI